MARDRQPRARGRRRLDAAAGDPDARQRARPALAEGRHLSRTKLGLALGAGGAKGFAHVGVLGVLEDAGYEVDVVTGSSIGAVAAACIAMGMRTGQVRRQLSHVLSREVCGPYFRLVTDGQDGPQLFYDALSALAGDATCDGLALPLGVLTADLNAQLPHAFTDGPLVRALHAALAIPGLAPALPARRAAPDRRGRDLAGAGPARAAARAPTSRSRST